MNPPLSTEATEALTRLIASNPYRWKQQLRQFWARGIALNEFETELYRLRNTHGPGWLKRFKAPNAIRLGDCRCNSIHCDECNSRSEREAE